VNFRLDEAVPDDNFYQKMKQIFPKQQVKQVARYKIMKKHNGSNKSDQNILSLR
jgi:hypothetical protein